MTEIEHIDLKVPTPIKFPEPSFTDTFDLVFNTATGNLVGETNFDDINEEPETWIESFAFFAWNFLLNYGMQLAILICAYLLFGIIFRKNYLQGVVSWWKKFTGHLGVLDEMKTLLEADYDVELWSEPAFCKKYLELYDAFRRFRSITNRDHLGNSILDDQKRQEEAKPLFAFFDVDYALHDRLIYAFNGLEPMEDDEEEVDESK